MHTKLVIVELTIVLKAEVVSTVWNVSNMLSYGNFTDEANTTQLFEIGINRWKSFAARFVL